VSVTEHQNRSVRSRNVGGAIGFGMSSVGPPARASLCANLIAFRPLLVPARRPSAWASEYTHCFLARVLGERSALVKRLIRVNYTTTAIDAISLVHIIYMDWYVEQTREANTSTQAQVEYVPLLVAFQAHDDHVCKDFSKTRKIYSYLHNL